MKKTLIELMKLCPGRVIVEFDRHKLFGETALDVILRNPKQYGILADEMISRNTIIMVEAAPIDKPMPPVIVFHYDLESALKNALNQIKLWQPKQD